MPIMLKIWIGDWLETRHKHNLGRVAPTSFMISVQLNLDQKLNQVRTELRCTKLNSSQLIPFSWTVVVIPWTMLIGQPRSAYGPTTVTSVTHNAYETVQCRLAIICSNFKFPWSYYTIFASTVVLIKFQRYALCVPIDIR